MNTPAEGMLISVQKFVASLGLAVAITYAGAVAYLVSQETRIVFEAGAPLGPGRPSPPFEHIDIPRTDGQRQFGWIIRHRTSGASAPWLLYLHGNSATVASRLNIFKYERFREMGLNVLAPEYRGFAGLDGVPSEKSVTTDARMATEYLRASLSVTPERTVIFGWSLGSAVAVNLASEVRAAAVILEGAPASLVALGERDYPWMPVRFVMRNPFESILKVPRVSAPMLFLHSPEDTVIPIEEGRRLFDAAPDPKQFVAVRGGHIDAAEVDSDTYFGAVKSFLTTHNVLEKR